MGRTAPTIAQCINIRQGQAGIISSRCRCPQERNRHYIGLSEESHYCALVNDSAIPKDFIPNSSGKVPIVDLFLS